MASRGPQEGRKKRENGEQTAVYSFGGGIYVLGHANSTCRTLPGYPLRSFLSGLVGIHEALRILMRGRLQPRALIRRSRGMT